MDKNHEEKQVRKWPDLRRKPGGETVDMAKEGN